MTQADRVGDPIGDARGESETTDEHRPVVVVLAAGAAVLLIATLFYAFVLPLTPVRMDRPSAGLIDESQVWSRLAELPWPVPEGGSALAAWLLAFGALSVAAYAAAVLVCWGQPATRRTLVAVLVPAGVLLSISALALPTQSSDIIDYVLSGRVAAVHGESPYEVAPDAFPEDPLLAYASGTYTSDPEQKPPVWIGGAVGAAALTSDADPADAILATRLMFLTLTFVNIGIIVAVLNRWRPRHLLAGVVIYAWNPIVLMHGPSRFDTLMATFALLAALFLVHGRNRAVTVALTLSVMVKLLTLPLLAVQGLGQLGARRPREFVETVAIVIGVVVLVYAPFDGGPLLLIDHLGLGDRAGSSLPTAVGIPLLALAVGAVLWVGLRSGSGDAERTLQAWAIAALAIIAVTPVGWAWYLISPIAIISLSGERWRTFALVGVSGVAFLADTWVRSGNSRHPLPTPLGLSRSGATLLGCVVVLVVLVAVVRSRGRANTPG